MKNELEKTPLNELFIELKVLKERTEQIEQELIRRFPALEESLEDKQKIRVKKWLMMD